MAKLRHDQVVCGAAMRAGHPCKRKSVPGKLRCLNHGGMSAGPKTAEGRDRIADYQRQHGPTDAGRERIAEAQRRRRIAYRAAKAYC